MKQEPMPSEIMAGYIRRRDDALYFFSDICAMSVADFISVLHEMEDDKSVKKITIHLLTDGGHDEDGWAMYDAIKCCSKPLQIIAHGYVYSFGLVVLLAAKNRTAHRHTKFMAHAGESVWKSYGHKDHIDKLMTDYVSFLTAETHINDEMIYRETYFNAEEALELGVITGILE